MGTFRAFFSGLCAYVPDAELGDPAKPPKKMMILMVDAMPTQANLGRKALDERRLRRHFPVMLFRSDDLESCGSLSPGLDLRWFFSRKQISFEIVETKAKLNDFKVVQGPFSDTMEDASVNDFNWGCHIKELVGDSLKIKLDNRWRQDAGSLGLIAARALLTKGELSTADLKKQIDFDIAKTLGASRYVMPLSHKVALKFVDVESVSVIATDLDNPKAAPQTLRFGTQDKDVDVTIGNFCGDSLEPQTGNDTDEKFSRKRRDKDFRWFFELFDEKSKKRVKKGLEGVSLPIPVPVNSRGGAGLRQVQCMRLNLHSEKF